MRPSTDSIRSWLVADTADEPLGCLRLLEESAPAAVILLFWGVLAQIELSMISTGLYRLGVLMAGLYAVVRGMVLSWTYATPDSSRSVVGFLDENVRVFVLAGGWFLAAAVFRELPRVLTLVGGHEFAYDVFSPLVFACAGGGVSAVLLYAVTIGIPRSRSADGEDRSNSGGLVVAD